MKLCANNADVQFRYTGIVVRCNASYLPALVVLVLSLPALPMAAFSQTKAHDASTRIPDASLTARAVQENPAEAGKSVSAKLEGLTVFYTQEQRDQQMLDSTIEGLVAGSASEGNEIKSDHVVNSVVQAPVSVKRSKSELHKKTTFPALYYTARLASGSTVRVLVNELPCQPVQISSKSASACAKAHSEVKGGLLLNCPHVVPIGYSLCLDNDWKTLIVLHSDQSVAQLRVGEEIEEP